MMERVQKSGLGAEHGVNHIKTPNKTLKKPMVQEGRLKIVLFKRWRFLLLSPNVGADTPEPTHVMSSGQSLGIPQLVSSNSLCCSSHEGSDPTHCGIEVVQKCGGVEVQEQQLWLCQQAGLWLREHNLCVCVQSSKAGGVSHSCRVQPDFETDR